MLPHTHAEDNHRYDVLRDLFDDIDADGSGKVDFDELLQLCRALGVCCDPNEVNELLKMIDTDKSGAVTFDEFIVFFKHAKDLKSLAETIALARSKDFAMSFLCFVAFGTMFVTFTALVLLLAANLHDANIQAAVTFCGSILLLSVVGVILLPAFRSRMVTWVEYVRESQEYHAVTHPCTDVKTMKYVEMNTNGTPARPIRPTVHATRPMSAGGGSGGRPNNVKDWRARPVSAQSSASRARNWSTGDPSQLHVCSSVARLPKEAAQRPATRDPRMRPASAPYRSSRAGLPSARARGDSNCEETPSRIDLLDEQRLRKHSQSDDDDERVETRRYLPAQYVEAQKTRLATHTFSPFLQSDAHKVGLSIHAPIIDDSDDSESSTGTLT